MQATIMLVTSTKISIKHIQQFKSCLYADISAHPLGAVPTRSQISIMRPQSSDVLVSLVAFSENANERAFKEINSNKPLNNNNKNQCEYDQIYILGIEQFFAKIFVNQEASVHPVKQTQQPVLPVILHIQLVSTSTTTISMIIHQYRLFHPSFKNKTTGRI